MVESSQTNLCRVRETSQSSFLIDPKSPAEPLRCVLSGSFTVKLVFIISTNQSRVKQITDGQVKSFLVIMFYLFQDENLHRELLIPDPVWLPGRVGLISLTGLVNLQDDVGTASRTNLAQLCDL